LKIGFIDDFEIDDSKKGVSQITFKSGKGMTLKTVMNWLSCDPGFQ
jgi:hypothetical protein